jgi:hypothetical protein
MPTNQRDDDGVFALLPLRPIIPKAAKQGRLSLFPKINLSAHGTERFAPVDALAQ